MTWSVSRANPGGLAWMLGCIVASGCADDLPPVELEAAASTLESRAERRPVEGRDVRAGKAAFASVLPGVTNQRSCATCHVAEHANALSPAEVATRPSTDPLFRALDADDPAASPLTFNNLKAGLVRVTLDLPENVDLLPIPPSSVLFAPPADSARILALWQASIVPGTRLGDPMPPDQDLGNGIVLHFQPEIITPPDRKISVWRAVPSIANTAYTAPYQWDARERTLQTQAFAALVAHGQLDQALFTPVELARELDALAAFQTSVFSDDLRAPYVARQIKLLGRYIDEEAPPVQEEPSRRASCYTRSRCGSAQDLRKPCCNPESPSRYCLSKIADPEVVFRSSVVAGMSEAQKASWDAGKMVYDRACAVCHGSATDDRITNRTVHDLFFPQVDRQGNLVFEPVDAGNGQVAHRLKTVARPDSEFLNIGAAAISHVGQIVGPSVLPLSNNQHGVTLPRYRLRFYEKSGPGVAPRSVPITDLPPLPVVSGGPPFTPALDPKRPGVVIAGPAFAPQLFSTDPGRALISGDWAEFEAFDVPQLRGIAKTAPYFHDNSQADLSALITTYSQFILPLVPDLDDFLPRVRPGTDRLTEQQKADLRLFLETF